MKSYPYYLVDAFTSNPLSGNPCAILFDTEDLPHNTMQAIAREMNLSETSFVRKSNVADFAARYFTPAEEIPMAGHPTIATVFSLVDSGRLILNGNRTSISLELKVGPIPVDVYASEGHVESIVMTQKKPQFLRKHDPAQTLPAFGLAAVDVLPGYPVQTVSTGTPQLMIPVRNQEALRRARLQPQLYERLRADGDFFSPHLFCLSGFTEKGQTSARHFGVPPDTGEDPFTGSATGGMAAYLWHYGLLREPQFIAEQGHWMKRPGQANVEVIGPRENVEAVRVGGPAVTVIRGEFTI